MAQSGVNYVLKAYATSPNLNPGDKLVRKVEGTLVAGALTVNMGGLVKDGAIIEYVILSKATVATNSFTAANTDPTDTGAVSVLVFVDQEDWVGKTAR